MYHISIFITTSHWIFDLSFLIVSCSTAIELQAKDGYNKIKIIYYMAQPQNFSLLKAQTHAEQQTSYNVQQLRAAVKQKEPFIVEYGRKIEQKRQEMKNLSKTVNVLIEKQLKKPTKQRPSFHVTYSSQKLNALRDQKNKIFAQIQHLKQQIKAQKLNHPQSIVNQVLSNEAKMLQFDKQIAKAEDTKSIIKRTLQQNKQKLNQMKENASLNDLQKKETEFSNIKKQCKLLEKEINMFAAQELQKSSFFFEIKDRCEQEIIEQKIQVQIDQNELKQLLRQINDIYEKRRLVETEGSLRIKNQQKLILQLQKSITQKKAQIRQLQNGVLRAGLSKKRMQSMLNLRNQQYVSNKTAMSTYNQKIAQKKKNNPEQKKKAQKRIINKIYMIQKDDANCIYIGQWLNDIKPMSDKHEICVNSIEKVKSITFSLANGRVIGVQSTYVDKNNLFLNGKQLKLDIQPQMKVQVILEEVVQLQYSRKSQEFYIRFILSNGSWRELGQRGSQVQKINLQPYLVKFVEALTNDSKTHISSLKLTLQQKIPQKLGLSDVAQRTSSQMSYSNFQSSVKKKVVLKGRSLKKIKEETIIDHRLMLNKQR